MVCSTGILASVNPDLFLENFAGIAGMMDAAGADFSVLAPLYTTFSLGWGAGKAACVKTNSVKAFSQLNVVPMAGMIYISHLYEDTQGLVTWALFLAAYTYFGFLDKAKSA